MTNLTREEILAATPDELDAMVAEHVMGWHPCEDVSEWWCDRDGEIKSLKAVVSARTTQVLSLEASQAVWQNAAKTYKEEVDRLRALVKSPKAEKLLEAAKVVVKEWEKNVSIPHTAMNVLGKAIATYEKETEA